MKSERLKPAQVFHPADFIIEELAERNWTTADLARRMGGNLEITTLALDIYISSAAKPDQNRNIFMGKAMAFRIGKAFGTSGELWINMEKAWLDGPAKPRRRSPRVGKVTLKGKKR